MVVQDPSSSSIHVRVLPVVEAPALVEAVAVVEEAAVVVVVLLLDDDESC